MDNVTVTSATVVVGGVSARTFRATQTEAYLKGKDITAAATLVKGD
jgi:xanthine dehydrogenase iron-sulfur cluster and FAD-binding subunit A